MSEGLKVPGSFEAMRTEGGISVRNKKRAVAEEVKRRRKMSELTVTRDGRLDTGVSPPPVLNVAPFPPYPAFTGSQVAMADRLEVERDKRTVALVYPRDGAWWLEVWSSASTGYYFLGTKSNLIEIITSASFLMKSSLVHIENNNGLPLNLVEGLENSGLRTILSLHDFVFFCRRPNLVEQPYGEFCNYSTEALRCKVCLRDIDPAGRTTQADYRRKAGPSLHDASILIFPSVFLQRQYEVLFPERHYGQKEVVVAPATARANSSSWSGRRRRSRSRATTNPARCPNSWSETGLRSRCCRRLHLRPTRWWWTNAFRPGFRWWPSSMGPSVNDSPSGRLVSWRL